MQRRTFLSAAGAAAVSGMWTGNAKTSLGTLAWVEAGSLWTRKLPDGRRSKVASADGLHAPRFSPSGRWILYRNHDDEVFVVRSDGQAGVSLRSKDVSWLPKEDRLAIRRGNQVALIAPGSEAKSSAVLRKVTGKGVFAPDGEQFVFGREVGRGPEKDDVSLAGQLCLGSLAAPGRDPEVLVSNEGSVQPYGWTRDGKSILYWRADEWSASIWSDGVALASVPAGGGHSRDLGESTLVHDDMVDLAPDSAGNQLAVTRGKGRNTWDGKRIATIHLDTGAVRNLTAENVAAICPVWSPDGQRIACVAAPDAEIAYQKSMAGVNISVMRTDGTVETKVVTSGMRIGPGGGEEAHAFLQQRKIWLLDPGGGNSPRQLTSDVRYRDEEPLWSADGGHILFGRMDYEGHSSMWLMESSGDNAVEVCRLKGDDWFGFYGYIDWRDGFDWRR